MVKILKQKNFTWYGYLISWRLLFIKDNIKAIWFGFKTKLISIQVFQVIMYAYMASYMQMHNLRWWNCKKNKLPYKSDQMYSLTKSKAVNLGKTGLNNLLCFFFFFLYYNLYNIYLKAKDIKYSQRRGFLSLRSADDEIYPLH